ncbi:DUF4439 domain-containing protein [Pseudarthrobacter sp. IC2-21]|uniref:DUF4439 domain-containing protein n=1 Tax=Pseudarthrobacter sp. IC2-21 TaxID=3092262 RepID=UPI002A69BD8C|nr:DUF4439 domain-containing protein [Pseudarthrobacter sp. IC2-21]
MNDDTTGSGPRRSYFRYAVFALAAAVVLSLGFVLIPREPEAPAPPPISEQARAAAFADTVRLRALALAAGDAAGRAGQGPAAAASQRAVTLLTMQARALMLPAEALPAASPTPPGASVSASPATASASAVPSSSAPPPAPSPATELAAALHESGARRLADAEKADGGMARLLGGTGITQVLAAEELAAATGTPLATLPGTTLPGAFPGSSSSSVPPSPAASSSAGPGTGSPVASCTTTRAQGGADLASSLTSVVGAEQELVYAYQAALTRLPPASLAPASDFLTQHEDLRHAARDAAAAQCAVLPPTPAGYALDAAFLADPAAALGVLEAGALPAYGDLVALSAGAGRGWALAALQTAARRTAFWGASPGPVAGVILDESALPQLPAADRRPSPGGTPAPGTP